MHLCIAIANNRIPEHARRTRTSQATQEYSRGLQRRSMQFFLRVCELNANETIAFLIECASARSNAMRRCRRSAATAHRRERTPRMSDAGAERSETAEGKIEEPARGRRGTASAQDLRRHASLNRSVTEMSKAACMLAGAGATRDWPRSARE